MPHIKFFQPLANIKNRYTEFFTMGASGLSDYYNGEEDMQDVEHVKRYLSMFSYPRTISKPHDLSVETVERIKKDLDILNYMLALRMDHYAMSPLKRPEPEQVIDLMNRVLAYYRDIYKMTDAQLFKHKNPLIRKDALCCKHYRFQYTLPGYVNKLPEVIHYRWADEYPDHLTQCYDLIHYFLKTNENKESL